MKVFLDDIRDPSHCLSYMYKRIGNLNLLYKEGWFVVRSYNEFIKVVCKNIDDITHISFDHDLADEHYHSSMDEGLEAYSKHLLNCKEKTGYDCAVWLKSFYIESSKSLPVLFVHSMNPVGIERIIKAFK